MWHNKFIPYVLLAGVIVGISIFLFEYLFSQPPSKESQTNSQQISENGWQFLGLKNRYISSIAFDPQRPNIIFVGAQCLSGKRGGIFKSEDGGANWDSLGLMGYDVLDLDLNPVETNILYAGNGTKARPLLPAIYKSNDGGITWVQSDSGMYFDPEFGGPYVAISPFSPNILYGITGGHRVYKTVNAAKSWFLSNNGIGGGSVCALALDPTDNTILYVGTSESGDLNRSTDAGST